MAALSNVDQQLLFAAEIGDVASISVALRAGANVNVLPREGMLIWQQVPLHLAARHGHTAAMEALLAAGAHVDEPDRYGWTSLMKAAAHGHAAAVAILLAAGADVHPVEREGQTALHLGCIHGHVAIVRALLDAGARTDVRDYYGNLPVDVVSALLLMPQPARSATHVHERAGVHRVRSRHDPCCRC